MGNGIALWDAATNAWFDLSSGLAGNVYAVTTMNNGDLVVGGSFQTAGGVPALRIARWDGKAWHAMGSGFSSGVVYALTNMPNGDVIAGGTFARSGATSCVRIARWDGAAWQPLGLGINLPSVSAHVHALAVLDGDLIAGGSFTNAGATLVNGVARWDGAAWNPVGPGVNGQVRSMVQLPNGEVAFGGSFLSAGGLGAAYFTRWSPTGLVSILAQPTPPQVVTPGGTVELNAIPSMGYKNVSIQWRRNGVAIVDGAGGASAGGEVVSGAAASLTSPTDGSPITLVITGAQSSDSGSYDVAFINACGEVISASVPVSVGEPGCPADFNNDGAVNSTDVSDFINQWFQDQVDGTLVTDWDANGVINSTDVSAFINSWFGDTALGCGG